MEELKVKPLSPTKSPTKSPKRPPPPPLAARVKVAVRVRPPVCCSGEKSPPLCICTEADPEIVANASVNSINFQLEKKQKLFQFDHVFSSEAAQADVYNATLQPLLASLLHGFNVTVLAYGQTGSGKTHTMGGAESLGIGSGNGDGLIPRLLRDLFDVLQNEASIKTTAKVSFLEIYCDEIRDLLVDGGRSIALNGTRQNSGPRLAIHEDNYDVWVEGLRQVKVKNLDEALNLLITGRKRQTIGAHALNDQSSRSHAVYTIEVSRAFANEIKHAKLTFVDLAGSERVKKTLMEGQGMKEGSYINIGLLSLGNVINALGSRQRPLQRRNNTSVSGTDDITPLVPAHVPYRSSKLTRLLRNALGGNSVTLFIACISPEITNGNETLCTLQYANRARLIQNKAQQNVEEAVTDDMVEGTESEREICALREQIAALKLQLDQVLTSAKIAEARHSSLVGILQNDSNSPDGNPGKTPTKIRQQLRIAPLELDIPEYASKREILESEQREGVVNKTTGRLQKGCFSTFSNTPNSSNQTSPDAQKLRAPDAPERFTPPKPSLVSTRPKAETISCNKKAAEQSIQIPEIAHESVSSIKTEIGATRPIPDRVTIDQSTQYEPPCIQHERKTPVDYVLLSPSQIFREVHHQKLKALGAPSPWPHQRRFDVQYEESSYGSAAFLALNKNNNTPDFRRTACSKSRDVLRELLWRTRLLVENSQDLWDLDSNPNVDDLEQKEGKQSVLLFETFVDQITALYDQRSRQHQVVHRLTQRFRHLATLLGMSDIDSQVNELSKYVLEHQQDELQHNLQAFERLAADRLWMRLRHREVAIENYAGVWNDKLGDAFLSEDQYEACTSWHAHREDHGYFQHRILPFVLNGWISVKPSDIENEQLWLTL
ncbi:hypothetical protein PHYPSEUDO_012227 [Phytophthora pseudosyringae]|uniref:Kinesin-like protein n=1 Tax=Phytophthora pseudosyringae TaxID=221518 RepID=A0A8T1V729_9STRA|nr:hypothetical protein PHYPSEUDO_012227 [Phytophthora pseudosyringae]